MSIRGSYLAALCALGLAVVGCEDKKAAKAEGADAGPPKPAVHGDKNIVDALQAEGSAMAQQGPPETGVFPPGGADRELKLGDPPKFALGLKGSEPAVTFVPPPAKPAKKLEGKVEVSVQTGPRSAMPTVELGLTTEFADKSADPATPAPLTELLVKATSSKLGADQPGQLPPGADKLIGKARGSKFTITLLPNGSGKVTSIEPAKDLDESLSLIVRAASDSFDFAFAQYPTDPVGKDAFWMVTSREQYAGLDAVVYRMYKILEVKPDKVLLDVNVKRLVSPGRLALPGIPPHHVDEFNDTVTGRIEVMPSDTSNIHGDLTDTILAALTPEGAAAQAQAQGQKMQIQMQIKTRVATGR
ncbi:MAG TPA: hypothetical protein VH062_22225 [Polyangiaceae bacterium]|jgi:hypothetical protein|nr:hypothetical protein [Polyangiaceae bacterium]